MHSSRVKFAEPRSGAAECRSGLFLPARQDVFTLINAVTPYTT